MTSQYTLTAAVLLTLAAASTAEGGAPVRPPPGDPCLTNRFGRSWSEPIYSGHLIVDGQYVDAPFIVEQRGYKIMVNGLQVDQVDPRCVLPPPLPEPITQDPGVPRDLTRDSPLAAATWNSTYLLKRRYWDYMGLSGEERVKETVVFLSQFPNIARVEDTGVSDSVVGRRLVLYGHDGQSMSMGIESSPPAQRDPPSDPAIHTRVMTLRRNKESSLRSRRLVFARNGRTTAGKMPPDTGPRWNDIFRTMAGDLPPEDRVSRLKKLGFLHRNDDVRRADNFFSISSFQPTDQLWQRLKGDTSWKDGSDARLHALTNGWQRTMPQFMRIAPQSPVAAAELTATPLRPKEEETEAAPAPPDVPASQALGAPQESMPAAGPHPHWLARMLIGGALLALLGAAILAFVRRR